MPSTTLPAFLDTNVPLYAVGAEHPLKESCIEIMNALARHPGAFMTDAEVLQEIIHRYVALNRWSIGAGAFERFAALVEGRTAAMLRRDVLQAASMVNEYARLSARDLVHLAVMRRLGVTRIVSSDRGFDGVPDLERLDPARFDDWRESVMT